MSPGRRIDRAPQEVKPECRELYVAAHNLLVEIDRTFQHQALLSATRTLITAMKKARGEEEA